MRKGGSNPTEGVRGCFGREAEARKELGHARQRLFTLTGLWAGRWGWGVGKRTDSCCHPVPERVAFTWRQLPDHSHHHLISNCKSPKTPMVPVIRRISSWPFEPKANPGAAIGLIDMTTAVPLFSGDFPRNTTKVQGSPPSQVPCHASCQVPGKRKQFISHPVMNHTTRATWQHGQGALLQRLRTLKSGAEGVPGRR